jgi:hypothetical protein
VHRWCLRKPISDELPLRRRPMSLRVTPSMGDRGVYPLRVA